MNGIKFILDDQGNHLDSYTISLESFRSFRGPLFRKPITGQEFLFAVSYSKPALAVCSVFIINLNSIFLLQKHNLDFVIDLHASSSMLGVFIQGNSYDSVYRYERHIVFPKMLAQNMPDFSQAQTFYNADLEKEGTARR